MRAWLRIVVPAVALVFVLTLPLALWNVPGFWRSVIFCQTVQPFRSDALSYPAFLLAFGHTPPPVLPTCLALTTLAIAVALWRAPRTPQGFATAATVVLGVFFAFNKQSFCNYWFLVLGCSALAIGAGRLKPEAPVEPGLQPAPGA